MTVYIVQIKKPYDDYVVDSVWSDESKARTRYDGIDKKGDWWVMLTEMEVE